MVRTRNRAKAETSWNRHMRGTESLWFYGTDKSLCIRFKAEEYFEVDSQVQGNVFVHVKSVLELGYSARGSILNQSNNDDDDPDNEEPQLNKAEVTDSIDEELIEKTPTDGEIVTERIDEEIIEKTPTDGEIVTEWIDEELIEKTPSDWKMSDASITSAPEITVGRQDGSETNLKIKVQSYPKQADSWTTYVRRVLSLGSGKSFKPTRQCDMPLEKPLLIQPLQDRQRLIESRFGMTVETFFLNLIEEANKANINNKSTTESDDGKWKLELYHEWPQERPGYKRMSVDPFYFYVTYIHEDDWHSYMTMLWETGTNPIRRFISFKDRGACNTLDELLINVGERDLKIQGDLSPGERTTFGLDLSQTGDDEAAANEIRRRKITDALKYKRLQGIDSQVGTYSFSHGQTSIEIALSDAKMAAASGKRASQLTQAAVMGGFSASDIASELGWERQRLSSGFFSSEWLHLAAFSWGGFMPPGADSGFSTSQNLENLIFGTSETNSLMTRYEMAWQDFYRKEQKLHDKLAQARKQKAIPVQGRLKIRCNDISSDDLHSRPIRYDVYTPDNKYKVEDFTFEEALIKEFRQQAEENDNSEDPKTMSYLYNPKRDGTRKRCQDSRHPDVLTSEGEMLLLAHDFPFIVYSIEYKIENDFSSILLNDKACAHFSFFPFQRSLYHQAEAVLDTLIWNEIKDGADAEVEEKIDIMEGRKPKWRRKALENTDKQTRFDLNYARLRDRFLNVSRDRGADRQQEEEPMPEKKGLFKVRRFDHLFEGSASVW